MTGAGRNEVAKLRWDEIDLTKRIWTLPAARSKNGQAHIVLLAGKAVEILASIPRANEFVFTFGSIAISDFAGAKRHLDALLPPDFPPWRFHDLRRTCASQMAELGVLPHVIEACLNHKSGIVSGLARTYNRHDYRAEKVAAMAAWADRLISGILKSESNIVSIAFPH